MKKHPFATLLALALVTSVASTAAAQMPPVEESAAPPPAAAPSMTVTTPVPQGRTAYNSIYVELLGNGLLYSINYDRMFDENMSLRVGLMYLGVSAAGGGESASATLMIVPIVFNYLLGSGSHKLELGAGPVILYASAETSGSSGDLADSGAGIAGTAVFGYRYVPTDGGFTFRGGFTPLFSQGGFVPWVGLSFGYVF